MTDITVLLRDSDKGLSVSIETPVFDSVRENVPASVELKHGDVSIRMCLASAKSVAFAINEAINSWALSKAIEKFPHMSDHNAPCSKEDAVAFSDYKDSLLKMEKVA